MLWSFFKPFRDGDPSTCWAIYPGLYHPPREEFSPKVQLESTKLSLGFTAPEKGGTAFAVLGNEHFWDTISMKWHFLGQ